MSFYRNYVYPRVASASSNPYSALAAVEEFVPPSTALPLSFAYLGYATARQKRGEKLARAGAVATSTTFGLLAYKGIEKLYHAQAPRLAPSFLLEAAETLPWLAGPAAGLLARAVLGLTFYFLFTPLEKRLEKASFGAYRLLKTSERARMRLEMGGNFKDTDFNQARRMQAVQEMSGALGNARRFMGNEAQYMHS